MFFKIIHPHEGTFRQKNINPFLALNCQIYVPWLIHHLNNLKNPKKKQTLKFLALGYLTEFMTRSVAGSCNLHASVLSGRMIGHLNDKMALLSFAHRFRFQTNPHHLRGLDAPLAPFLAPFQAFAPASNHLSFGAKVVPVTISQN